MEDKVGKVELVNIHMDNMNPAPYNPRKISSSAKDGLAKSLESFGLLLPIVYNKRTNNIVGGHQRYEILMDKGVETTDVIEVDWPIEKEKAANITLNNKAISGEYTGDVIELLSEVEQYIGEAEFIDLKLDELETETAKAFKNFDAEFESGSNSENTGSTQTFETSNVKMVQLFLDNDNFAVWNEMVNHCMKKYSTDNMTDAVVAAISDVCGR